MPGTSIATTPDPNRIIQFTESDHKYVAKDKNDKLIKELISVTTLIGNYFPKFDADLMAPKVAVKRGLSVEQIKAEWKQAGEEASRYGTRVHEYLEDLIRGVKPRNIPENDKETKVFGYAAQLARKIKSRFTDFKPEKIVSDVQLGIAGTIDLLCRDPRGDGSVVILDWKTNKQIRMIDQFGKKGFGPVAHVEDCEFGHYSLQLNLYEFILKHAGYILRNTNVVKYLVHLHPDLGVNTIRVPDMQQEIINIVNDYLTNK